MKKILLGLLALSAISFANPGTGTAATVKMEAQLEVLPANGSLLVEELLPNGNWQPITSPTLFNHGRVVQSTAAVSVPDSDIVKKFRVRRSDNNIFHADGTAFRSLSLAFRSAVGDTSKGKLITGRTTTTQNIPTEIDHNFKLSKVAATVNNTISNIPFEIISSVPTISANQLPGIYNRVEDITVTLQ